MSVINNNLLLTAAAGGATVGRSIRLNAPDSANLSRTPASAGDRKTWTWSGWVKLIETGLNYHTLFSANPGPAGTNYFAAYIYNNRLTIQDVSGGAVVYNFVTSQLLRDYSAWYHFVFALDTTQATASQRFKLYLNGQQITSFNTSDYPATQNALLTVNRGSVVHSINNLYGDGSYFGSFYLALVHFIDGQALTPSSFGETSATTGQWVAKTYSGSYGTNGFFLDFADNSTAAALGYDAAGSNDWTVNNLSVTAGSGNDSLRDHPTSAGTSTGAGGEVAGNYCTFNPLDRTTNAGTLTDGNLNLAQVSAGAGSIRGTIGVSSGKWYFEVTPTTAAAGTDIGVVTVNSTLPANWLGTSATAYTYYQDGDKANNNTRTSYGTSWTTNDVIGVALDLDNGKIFFAKNNTWQNSGNPTSGTNPAFSGLSGTFTVGVGDGNGGNGSTFVLNCGQRAFAYTAPSGFSPLVDTLLPTPTIAKPNTVMDVLTWTGTSSGSNRTLTGLNFSPDLVWGKARSVAYGHRLYDSVRGAGNNKDLNSASTGAEGAGTDDQYGYISSFDSAGFSTTAGTADNDQWNSTNQTFAAWCWDAGSSNATNTSGTITSTVRANISAGFSVVTYTGTASNRTVGHGLGVAPSLIIVKNRSTAVNWRVYHSALGANKAIFLNTTDAADTWADYWNNTAPTSTTFSIGPESGVNGSGNSMVAYCWTPVAGYSAFGSYTGNGSSDGTFIYTGFRPRWIMLKSSSTGGVSGYDWIIYDTSRSTYNLNDTQLIANSSGAENTDSSGSSTAGIGIDILSNGFKQRLNSGGRNSSGVTYIYACFAEAPFPYARAR